jgi:hypothetical protein
VNGRLVFCEGTILECWIIYRIAQKVERRILADRKDRIELVFNYLDELCAQGVRLSTTLGAASGLITQMYKGQPPLSGNDTADFRIRKSFAKEAVQLLSREVVLLAPTLDHFERAELLWYKLCEKGEKKKYAQFSDYVDAALVLNPPEKKSVFQVVLDHDHIGYILSQVKSGKLVHRI